MEEKILSNSGSTKINELIPALKYVCEKGRGTLEELQTKVTERCITELAAAGFIAYGATLTSATWKATKYATTFNNDLSPRLTTKEKIQNFIFKYILGI